jgi:FKBP-type peptidyl-prolyl cis-trans isomerase (trigger factor)
MIEIKLLPGSKVEIAGEISAGDFMNYKDRAIKEISGEIKIDGFRPGSAPEKILLEKIGEPALLEKMATIALQKEYPKIITGHKIKAIGQPEIVITKITRDNPLAYKIKTSVMPEIELPDYKKIAKEISGAGDKRLEILNKISSLMKADIPEILIEAEKHKILEETKANIMQIGLKWEDYLGHLKKTEEEITKGWGEDALKRVKNYLILNEIAEKEKIEVPEEELERETDKIMEQYKNLDKRRVKIYTYGIIRNEKVFQFLESC